MSSKNVQKSHVFDTLVYMVQIETRLAIPFMVFDVMCNI